MLRVIVERHLTDKAEITHILQQLRSAAMQWPGYISGETLVSTEDEAAIIVISTWRSLDDWRVWERSDKRSELYKKVAPYLTELPKVSTYQILSTGEKSR